MADFRDPEDDAKGGKKALARQAAAESKAAAKRDHGAAMFSFINTALSGGSGSGVGKAEEPMVLRKQDEGELRSTMLNTLTQTEELTKRLGKLREALQRNIKNPGMAAQIRAKIKELEGRKSKTEGEAVRVRTALTQKHKEKKPSKHLF